MRTRIAPTPSGFLHAGNAVNVLLVSWWARAQGGTVILRIDDMDRDRYRPEYVDDIFSVLEWLDITIDEGPSTTREFEASYSMQERGELYRTGLGRLRTSSRLETFACACSRSDLARGLTCDCRGRGLALEPHRTALRVHIPDDIGDRPDAVDDFIAWRRDDTAAYQLASVLEDDALGVTHILRGLDLEPSTWIQRLIAPDLGATTFERAVVLHHRLLMHTDGQKLSKSTLRSGPMDRTLQQRDDIRRTARTLAEDLQIAVP